MDELKKYLHKHADELNLDEPRAQVWQNIQQQTATAKKPGTVILFTRWAAAACVLVLAGIGTWYVLSEKKTSQQPLAVKTEKKIPTTVPVETAPPVTDQKDTRVYAKNYTSKKTNKPINEQTQVSYISSADLGALHELENSFTQVINLQQAKISSMPMYAETPEYFNDFKIQIRQMEKDEKVIKSDIARRGMNDELLDQLINLYQQKLNVLKQLQTEMNKTNSRYKQNRGIVDSSKTYFIKM